MKGRQSTLLVVDDNRGVLAAVSLLLQPEFDKVVTIASPARIPELLRSERPVCVLLDMNFSAGLNTGNEGLYWLREIKRLAPDTPVVLFTAYADIDLAVKGIKEGAADFVVKPWDNARLVDTVVSAARCHSGSRRGQGSSMFWGDSEAMRELRAMVERVARTDVNILITGENGTGKEMLAREVHALSPRASKPMVTVDMGAVTDTLFESELFGHVRGAFTHAERDRAGKFEAAHGSTLFMDEIGNLPYALQSKLLSALQSRRIVRVGSNDPIEVDFRLICATNCDLDAMVEADRFRQDLLYRINTIRLVVPPLRERVADIAPLASMFLDSYARRYGRSRMTLSDEAVALLESYSWPGNVRELQHIIEKAVIISDSDTLLAAHFNLPVGRRDKMRDLSAQASTLDEMEASMIVQALKRHGGNHSAVAMELGISRQTLYNKMKKYGL